MAKKNTGAVAPPSVASPNQPTSLLLEQQKQSGYAIF
jgi:hypothetical protein